MTQWSLEKPRRTQNRKLLDEIKKLPCVVCGSKSMVDPCHIRSKGAGGPDEEYNVIPMCRDHHAAQHRMGFLKMFEKYPRLKDAVEAKGWRLERGKLRR